VTKPRIKLVDLLVYYTEKLA